jgi:hypothetical protein
LFDILMLSTKTVRRFAGQAKGGENRIWQLARWTGAA